MSTYELAFLLIDTAYTRTPFHALLALVIRQLHELAEEKSGDDQPSYDHAADRQSRHLAGT